jgi:hypothetical protein
MRKLQALCMALILCCALPVIAQQPGSQAIKLLTNESVSGAQKIWPGGIGVFAVSGTWNGATVTLEFLGPDGTTMIVAGLATTLTVNGAGVFYLPRGIIQAIITSAGGSTSLSATASPLPSFIG